MVTKRVVRRILLLPLVLIGNQAMAEVNIKEYDRVKNAEWFRTYLGGVGVGISWANTASGMRKGKPLYCAPSNLPLNQENYLEIAAREIEVAKGTGKLDPDTPVELLLLHGLQRTFPCP